MFKGILLGAGFSYDLGMPLTNELTEIFLEIFTKEKSMIFAEKLSRNDPYGQGRPISKDAIFEGFNLLLKYKAREGKNYEEFLSNLQKLGKTQSDKDSYHYLFGVFYEIIHDLHTRYQIESYGTIYNKNFEWFSSLRTILSEKETWIFTLNHDLYMECLAIDLGLPITYGDSEEISFPINNINMENKINFTCANRTSLTIENASFFKDTEGINLVKIHGGLSELEYNDSKIICNQSLLKKCSMELLEDFKKINDMAYYHLRQRVPSGGRDRVITNSAGERDIICKSMLTGGSKYSLTTNVKKGEEKLKLFDDTLKNLDELTIIGYGFGDPHINYRISNAMAINSKLRIRIVDPIKKSIPEFLQQFNYDSRIGEAICGAAHWMDYLGAGKWNKAQMDGLKENESYRRDIKNKIKSIVLL